MLWLSIGMMLAANVTGKVVDRGSLSPIDFANVVVYPKGSDTPTEGTITDATGVFHLSGLKNGQYRLVISFLGYVNLEKEFSIQGQDVKLGNLHMKEDTRALQEVEVVAQGSTMRFELDKKIFTVDQNIAAAGASVSEALENVPTVNVDQEGNISMRNSEDVEIWINGKPAGLTADNRAQILQQMPAGSIKQIELITNPSAKYSPEGTAGIINLVMKEDRKAGYYGSVQAGISYGLAKPWTVPPGANAGVNLNFNAGPVDGFFNVGYRLHTSNGGSMTERYNLPGNGEGFIPGESDYLSHLTQTGINDRRGRGMFVRGGLNFRLAEHSSLGVQGFGMINDPKALRGNNLSTNTYAQTAMAGDTLRLWERQNHSSNYHPGGNVRLDYTFKYDRHQLIVAASYDNFQWYSDDYYTQIENLQDTLLQQQNNSSCDQSIEVRADYEWKPTRSSRLEAGYLGKLAWRNSEAEAWNDHHMGQELYQYYTLFNNNEQNHALYITYGNRWWDKLSLQVGLRGEYFMRHLEGTEKNQQGTEQSIYAGREQKQDTAYFQLFPSAYLSYDFGKGHELQLNYTRRVDRPRGHQLNPQMNFSDSTNIRFGNPDLLPSYSSSLELNYLKTWELHTLSAGLFWRYRDGIVQNVKFMTDGVMKNTFVNVAKRQELGVEVVAKNRLFHDHLQLTTSANLYWNTITDGEYDNYVNGEHISVTLPGHQVLAWSARINAQVMMTKTFSGQISANYSSPQVVAQGKTTHSYSIDLGVRKTFLDRKLALAVNVRDILDSRARRTTNWGEGFYLNQKNRWHSRTISATLTYNFGNNQPKRGQRPDTMQNAPDMSGEMEEY